MTTNTPEEGSKGGTRHDKEVEIIELKKQKSVCKAKFTRNRNKLLDYIKDEQCTYQELKDQLDIVEEAMDNAVEAINQLIDTLTLESRTDEMIKASKESEIIEEQYEEMMKVYHSRDKKKEKKPSHVDNDMNRQLKRVSIPVFTGNKKQYEFWKSAFMTCVDSSSSTDEYKFLQLRQYLGGEAVKVIEGLGHSAAAYEAAKERLERKYGGQRRRVHRFLEELDAFPVIRYENTKMIEKFADLLDIALINMKEKDSADLDSKFMYLQLIKKLPETMIVRFQRWLHQNDEEESIEILKTWVVTESEFNAIASETKHGLENRNDKFEKSKDQRTHFARDQSNRRKLVCKVCAGEHGAWQCSVFQALDTETKWQKAKTLKLCYRCLGDNHAARQCKRTRRCGVNGCDRVHHKLLHNTQSVQSESRNAAESLPDNFASHLATENTYIALRTVPVILSANGKKIQVNALLDDGSTKTYLNQDVASELNIEGEFLDINVNVLNGRSERIKTMTVEFTLESVDKSLKQHIVAHTANEVTGKMRPINWNQHANYWNHLKGIKFPELNNRKKIDILIGLDYSELHRSLGEIHGEKGTPTARLTPLGWTCVGPVDYTYTSHTSLYTFNAVHQSELRDIDDTLKKFWELETVENRKPLSKEENLVIERTKSSMNYNEQNCRYEVSIPWKENKQNLVNNYDKACSRLEGIERKLNKNPELKKSYEEIIERYEEKGYITKIKTTPGDDKWYLPHFPVVRPDKETTKVRLVFDASARYEGLSLNECINPGPKLQNELFHVLLRFRRHEVAVMCDISEMYLQVGLSPPDRQYHRFLWRSDIQDEIHCYEFNRLVFGINASPFLAQYVASTNASKFSDIYPLASESILKSTYMDDTMDSVSTEEAGIQLYHELKSLWGLAGMEAKKWMSNSKRVLERVPQNERVGKIDIVESELPSLKTLGLNWISEDDVFSFRKTDLKQIDMSKFTKRSVLKQIATIFDPLGFIAPFTVTGKILMQEIWVTGIDWDDQVSEELAIEIRDWLKGLESLDEIKIPRCINVNKDTKLHTFVDASSKAFGSVVYSNNEGSINLIAAKSRVAPLKCVSIPRLELLAAVLGLKLTQDICSALELPIENTVFWSDSMNVLYWVHSTSRQYKTFVANRIGLIHDITSPTQWRFVPTALNPADLTSRGTTVGELVSNSLWLHGPDFLQGEQSGWPENKFQPNEEATIELKRKSAKTVNSTFVNIETVNANENRLDPERYSSWSQLVRVNAWVNRFIDNCQSRVADRRKSRELSLSEIQESETRIIQRAQMEAFQTDYKCLVNERNIASNSKLTPLNPKLDTEGLIRANTRLNYAEHISYDTKHPIILPRKHAVTRLIVKHYHERVYHSGTNQTLAALSTKYWILSAREAIREWELRCTECKLRKAKVSNQIMAPLPVERLGQPMRAFSNTAVDYAGPFITKQGRGKTRLKRYLCVFTCMSTRAVHLEVSYNLDTNSFINTLYRFTSRRGVPHTIVSDNGTNFVGCVNELKGLYKELNKDQIIRKATDRQINWKFIPPGAPHFGGVHESMVKSAKKALYAILGNADITDEELITATTTAESLINSRPLTYQTSNANDDSVLTPNHFLYGELGGDFAPEETISGVGDIRKRWRRVQELVRHFWKRWFKEYLPMIGQRNKWYRDQRDFQEGDVVIVVDPDLPRGKWQLGRVEKVHSGKDGHVRVVDVRVGKTTLRRPITRISFLEECK